jgi:lipopolysaccharide biosynthesis regulator YciM
LVYEQQRDWRAALDIWQELPPEQKRERADVAAHYYCELGEAALAAREFDQAHAHLASARVHAAGAARVRMLAARIAAAEGDESKTLDLYTEALAGSRTIQDAFGQEALVALPSRAAELVVRLREQTPVEPQPPPIPARFRCQQCGVASVTWHWRCPSCRTWDSLESVVDTRR